MHYKLGSLFDGSGGFPLSGSLCGIDPVWASEIEPYPIAVTRSRFPNMKHLGSVTEIKGNEIEPVDVITFGSPCQDLSIAGKRAGIDGKRSGLFMEAIRIIKEMRESTNGIYPAFAIWENVTGAFSSNRGEDFRTVLEELVKIVEPEAVMPTVPKNGWPYSDCYSGDGYSLAYRVFDAQYWGVPQRRRRIYLVLDLRDGRAGEILFKRKGLRGYFEAGRTPWEADSEYSERSPGTEDSKRAYRIGAYYSAGMMSSNPRAGIIPTDISATLDCNGGSPASQQGGVCIVELVPYTMKIRSGCDGGGKGALIQTDKSATLSTMNDQYLFQPVTESYGFNAGNGSKANTIGFRKECSPTIRAEHSGTNQVQTVSIKETLPFDTTEVTSPQNGSNPKWGDPCHPLTAQGHPPTVIYSFSGAIRVKYIVRRLTPTECARLQGFPDKWGHPDIKEDFTDDEYKFWFDVRNAHASINGKSVKNYTKKQMISWYNKLHTDSSEYKMWGNGIALPNALYVMQGISDALY